MIITALLMGFAGSLHCVGMCSPLAMAVSNMTTTVALNRLIYNAGRILTYSIMGAVIGAVGHTLPLSNYQNLISLVLGIFLVIFALLGITSFRVPFLTTAIHKFTIQLKSLFLIRIQKKGIASMFILGLLNGTLPCGLTFLALAYCLSLKGSIDAFYFMMLFGVGTLPAMLGAATLLQYLVKRFNLRFNQLSTSLLLITGCLLIIRVFFLHEHSSPQEQHIVDIVLCR